MLEIDDIAKVIAGAVREATAPLNARIAELEARPLAAEPMTAEEVRSIVEEKAPDIAPLVERIAELESRPLPELPDIKALVSEEVAALAATLPMPEKGDPGEPGEKGEPGEVDMEAVRSLIDEAVKAIPAPEPVEPLAPDMEAIASLVQDGIKRAVAELPPAEKGEVGVGLTGAMIDREGDLILTLSDGETRNVGRVVGKDGESPPPFTLDDFDIVPTNERTIEIGFTHGDTKHIFELEFPVLIGRGVWSASEEYSRGDVVTWGGSAWEAVEPAKGTKPDLSKGGWRILVKRGRDGKDAK